jgi:eukaryotic-like serine/threonine-protein kinase
MNSAQSGSQVTALVRSGSRSMFRTIAAGGLLVKKQLWIWPILAALLLGGIGFFVRNSIENSLKADLRSELQTILAADVKALELWMRSQETVAVSVAGGADVARCSERLVALAARPETKPLDLLQAPELEQLRAELEPVLAAHGYIGWVLADGVPRIVASRRTDLVGNPLPTDDHPAVLERALKGKATVSAPRKSLVLLPAADGTMKAGVPTMFAWGPVRNKGGEVIAALGLRIRPELDFTEILGIARAGETGETYAFNREGLFLSNSRFNEQLRDIGLLREDEDSILNLQLRDPEVDMTRGERPVKRRSEQALTRLGVGAVEMTNGVDVDGYRDYRGVPSVGAWTWLDEYQMGIATEQDSAEAFAPLFLLRQVFWALFALLGGAAAAIFGFTIVVSRLSREARLAALKTKQLGQYALDEKLGEGGMGVVYRAHHAMLHRPTAVKFLHAETTNEHSIARFEREVRLTARLNHPNTIAIYDYGRTPEGIFYYAMEYLEGINLEDLVKSYGPQPENRVIFILQQVCSSLAEAHRIGLIHRDIKPANIMLTERGGLYDFVKLLDFGLVKAVDNERETKLTAAGAFTGTPLYLSPEAVRNPDDVDARSDLYAVGAVGYYLLTGSPVFEGTHVLEIVQKHALTMPVPPSQRSGQTVSAELEALLLMCLAKRQEDRPPSASVIAAALSAIHLANPWTNHDAEQWWLTHGLRIGPDAAPSDTREERLGVTLVVPTVEVQTP